MKMKLKPAAIASLVLLSTLAVGAQAQSRKTYIVQLKDEPVVTYRGTISGLAATAPTAGAAFRYGTPEVTAYASYLEGAANTVTATLGDAPILARYNTVFNGFAAQLTEEQALSLSTNGQVAGIWEDEARQLDTVSTSKFLGLSTPGGLWSKVVGGSAVKGENLVVGIIDGGIWPENPAFFDRVDSNGVPSNNPADTQVYGPAPATFTGSCVAGEGFDPAKHCNNKLIGAKAFRTGFDSTGNVMSTQWDFNSVRDPLGTVAGRGSHGDHTASTAAGNDGATAIIGGVQVGTATGVAPRARVAAYKVCWTWNNAAATDGTGTSNNCWNSDSMAAIDEAVKDGVNVINFSISGSQTTVNDPVEQAFYRASLAGVFVAASAGNSGPGTAVAHISPWLTTVAASTHDRAFNGDVSLGNGAKYTGASMSPALVSGTFINAEDAGVGGANASLCFSTPTSATGGAALDPAKVTGKIVVCTRGTNARVDKSLAVLNAGGIGMVLADNGAGLVTEPHSVPTVHVSSADGTAIKSYVTTAAASATGSVSKLYIGTKPAPVMIGFSSRGPNQGDSNVLKPDLTAPGVDIIASGTPESLTPADRSAIVAGTLTPPAAWTTLSGTSMSSPHVAGLALLLKQANPTWTPAMIKSALMTSAYSTLDDGLAGLSNGLLPWSQGAGHVSPNKAVDPGLVYDAGKADYVAYQCKVNRAAMLAADCTTYGTLDETYNLNLPSMTAGTVLGSVTFKRRVTNVTGAAATFTATASVPGFTTVVTPSTLSLAAGASANFTVKLTATTAAEGVWGYGQLVWTDGTRSVRSPIQAKIGKPISVPAADFTGTTTSGSRLFTIKTGFAGRMSAVKGGMKDVTMSPAADLLPKATSSAALKTICQAGADTANVKVYNFAVPANTIVARFALRQADTSDVTDDNDMMILYPDNSTSLYSGNDGSNEAVQVLSPAAGNYRVCVVAYGTSSSLPAMTHSLSSWIVGANEGTSLRVSTPQVVYSGGTATMGLSWSGLATGKRYVGGLQYRDAAGVVQATSAVRVSTDGAVPLQNEPASNPRKLVAAASE